MPESVPGRTVFDPDDARPDDTRVELIPDAPVDVEPLDDDGSDDAAPDREARVERLEEGAAAIRNRRGSFIERTGVLLIASAVLVTLGLSLIIVAWSGTSHSIHVEEQIPYVVSGGLLGATLAIIGAFCLFTHWLTVSIREARAREERDHRRHQQLLDAISGNGPYAASRTQEGGNNGHASGGRRERPLRSAPRGS